MNQITKNQHYVPKFYLKRFANEKEQVQILDLKSQRINKPRHYSSVCYEKFFYGIESGVFDETSQEFENWFQHFENIFGDSWESIILNALNRSLTVQNFDVLSWFLSLQMMRTKKFRDILHLNIEQTKKEIFKKYVSLMNFENRQIVEHLEKDLGRKIKNDELKNAKTLLLQGDYKINFDNASFLNHLVRNCEGIRNLFFWQQWTVIRNSDKWNFITTDNPVIEWMPKPKTFWGYSFIERNHYFPVCPEILIELKLGSVKENVPPHTSVIYRQANNDEVMMYNFLISDHSHSFAYSPSKNELVEMMEEVKRPKIPLLSYWANYANR